MTTPILIAGAMYSKSQLDAIFGRNSRRFAQWKKAGLAPLTTGTREEFFLADDLLRIWKAQSKGRQECRKRP
jgi:hypothetical protein